MEIIDYNKWVHDTHFQKKFDIQCSKYYHISYANIVRKNMEYEDYTQHMLLILFRSWKYYTGEIQADTFTDRVVKRETIRLYKKYSNFKNKVNTLENNIEIDKECETQTGIFDIPHHDEHEEIHELIDYIITGVKENDKDICKLYLLGYSIRDIEKFTDYTYRQIQWRVKKVYNDIFKKRYQEYYGI